MDSFWNSDWDSRRFDLIDFFVCIYIYIPSKTGMKTKSRLRNECNFFSSSLVYVGKSGRFFDSSDSF